ncbi:MAG: NAD+ synthase [Dehalococcoidia bacterium]
MQGLRVALAQINTTVGDLDGNARLIERAIAEGVSLGADVVTLPELAVTGYPPEDLVLYPKFVADNKAAVRRIAATVHDTVAVAGFVDEVDGRLYNAAAILANGEIAGVYHKIHLPNYGVFDERRYFARGRRCPLLTINGVRVGVNICEDIWETVGPSEVQCAAGAQVILNINASPYEVTKQQTRIGIVTGLARRNRAFAIYTNQVGGQDELVFDGGSMAASPSGEIIAAAPQFEETVIAVDLQMDEANDARLSGSPAGIDPGQLAQIGEAYELTLRQAEPRQRPRLSTPIAPTLDLTEAVYRALVTGTRDYLGKTGFKNVAVALSGGIDSSLVAAIAVDALGADNVVGVSLPSRYSSEGSITDAIDLAERLGIPLWRIPIEPAHRAFEEMLEEAFEGTEPNTAEENMQSRIRGNIMMAIANKFGWLVLTTGNKSEMATGYATLYGDMAGGFAVIKDVPKTLVYELCEHRNKRGPGSPIPQAVIDKPPSAELRPGQLDEDSLPPYPVLDRILDMYIEQRLSSDDIVMREAAEPGEHADEATVRRVTRLVDINEYKRRQSPPGVKITRLAFGRDRRLPIASRYRG